MARDGAKVIISSRKAKNVEEATKKLQEQGLDVKGLVCHVSKPEDRKKIFDEAKKLGGLDILVSNAAVNPEVGGVLDVISRTFRKFYNNSSLFSALKARGTKYST